MMIRSQSRYLHTGPPSMGRAMLMRELTGETIVLRHPDRFEPDVVIAARSRLEKAGVDIEGLLARNQDITPEANRRSARAP